MEAWHFLKAGGYTGEGNLLVVEGQTMRESPPVKLCRKGLHFSVRAIDALHYAPGPVIQRVWVPDDSILGYDKGVAVERKCLWMYDATEILHEFGCQCAESALMIGEVEDDRSWNAIHVKREWLAGRATDADLAAARAAARATAGAAAWAMAWATAGDAARAAARATAGAAAWAAAGDAAWAMAWATAEAAARDAVGSAAWNAAWEAVTDEMNVELERLVLKHR